MEMIFVLDCSGSMKGKPIEKAKDAIRRALRKLEPNDTFDQSVSRNNLGATRLVFEGKIDRADDVDVFELGPCQAGDRLTVDFEAEIGTDLDGRQLIVMGNAALILGTLLSLLVIVPNPPSGRLWCVVVAGTILAIGLFLKRKGISVERIKTESEG